MQQDFTILPTRNKKSDSSLQKLTPITYHTNYYAVHLNLPNQSFYQYDIQLPQDIPHDSVLYHRAVYSILDQLKESIGYLTHKGTMIWGTLDSPKVLKYDCQINIGEKKERYEALINRRKIIDSTDQTPFLQVMNILLKQSLAKTKLCELGKAGKFFNPKQETNEELEKLGLSVIRGYQFTLVPLNRGIALRIDSCSRVLQNRTFLELIKNTSADFKESLIDSIVIAKYGGFKTYKILSIEYDLTPESTFFNKKNGKQETYRDYYARCYNVKIKDMKQPLLKAVSEIKKFKKNGKTVEEVEYIYLVPELVSTTGLTKNQQKDINVKRALIPFTQLSPNQRVQYCQNMIKKLNASENSFLKIKENLNMKGYCLPQPQLFYSKAVKPDAKGNIKYRGPLKEAYKFDDWLVVYSEDTNDNEADDIIDCLCEAGQTYGITFKDPKFLTLQSRKKSFMKELEQNITAHIKDHGKPGIVVFILAPFEEKYYGDIKNFMITRACCPSQVICKKKFKNFKGRMSTASKLCIQMNVKAGSTPWVVSLSHKLLQNRSIMYGAISFSKGKRGYTLSFVGTISRDFAELYSNFKVNIKSKEKIDSADLEKMFTEWAKAYYIHQERKEVANTIIIYRQNLSDEQARTQLKECELEALEKTFEKLRKATPFKNYSPQISIVLVNQKSNDRFFEQNNNGSKFFNPQSGSIILDEMSKNNQYDFHLTPQNVTKGSCSPTLFKVAYDTTNLSQEALIEFTYSQCFNYYNWQGAVKVPACLQSANKLSKLAGDYIQEDIPEKEGAVFKNSPYFY